MADIELYRLGEEGLGEKGQAGLLPILKWWALRRPLSFQHFSGACIRRV